MRSSAERLIGVVADGRREEGFGGAGDRIVEFSTPNSKTGSAESPMENAHNVGIAARAQESQPPREEFWNLPNTISTFRLAVVPVLMLMPFAEGRQGSQLLAWLYIVAALSDILDGWLARSDHDDARLRP